MKASIIVMWVWTAVVASSAWAQDERIGVYDSRAVAIAFAGSPLQAEEMRALKSRHAAAHAAGNAAEVARLEAEGAARQKRLHAQGFGTAPVDDLLAYVAPQLPGVRERAGVSTLISKWDEAALAAHAQAVRIDVTWALVEAFAPSERARRHAREIVALPPQPAPAVRAR